MLTRVVVQQRDRLAREALAHWLAALPGYVVTGEADSGGDLLRACTDNRPDVVLLDASTAGPAKLAAVARLRTEPASPYLIGLHRTLSAPTADALHKAGVHRLVSHRTGLAGLHAALREARETRQPIPAARGLTQRELEVLRLICAGTPAQQIAGQLTISPHTVANHTRRIFGKLNVCSRAQAAAEATRLGLWPTQLVNRSTVDGVVARVTEREHDILASIARGDSVRQTARALGIAEKTVQNVQRQLFCRLGVHNRSEALTKANGLGLVRDPGR